MIPQKFANVEEMVHNDELWEEHPLLVSYQNFYDATTGIQVARIATFHRRVEEYDEYDVAKLAMIDLYNTPSEPPKVKT